MAGPTGMHERSRGLTMTDVVIKTAVVHTLTYVIAGAAALVLLDYRGAFAQPVVSALMKPVSDPMVSAGPLFQPVRGALFGVVFYLLRQPFFERPQGWLRIWIVLVVLGILSTFGPAPGSIEGLIYTKLPVRGQITGLSEVLAQSLMLAVGSWYWIRHPGSRWLGRVLWTGCGLVLLMSVAGLLASR